MPSPLANASLTNQDNGEVLFFQFHPTSLEEKISVEWGRSLPLFASHEVSHYNGTRSEVVSLGLIYTSIGGLSAQSGAPFTRGTQGGNRGLTRGEEALPSIPGTEGSFEFLREPQPRHTAGLGFQDVRGAERFLKSLCYGNHISDRSPERARSRSFSAPAPPLVLFDWPETVTMEGYIDRVSIRFDRFDSRTLQPLILRAEVDFREETNKRITGKDVRVRGSNRATRVSTIPRVLPQSRSVSAPTGRTS